MYTSFLGSVYLPTVCFILEVNVGTYITCMNGVYRELFTTQFFVLMDVKMKYWHSTLDPTKTRTHLPT